MCTHIAGLWTIFFVTQGPLVLIEVALARRTKWRPPRLVAAAATLAVVHTCERGWACMEAPRLAHSVLLLNELSILPSVAELLVFPPLAAAGVPKLMLRQAWPGGLACSAGKAAT